VRNELQNAADAGALAGTRVLYDDNGTSVNAGANQVVMTRQKRTEVNSSPWKSTGRGEIPGMCRGPLELYYPYFYPNDSLLPVDLWDVTAAELDANTNFINAVKVIARRETSPATSFFARIFGRESFALNAEAVAYIGFAGTLQPFIVEQPIAICKQSITKIVGNEYTCATGRMMNATIDTAAWTNLYQPCETAKSPTVNPLICAQPGANQKELQLGQEIGTTNGQDNSIWKNIWDCWKSQLSLDTVNSDGIPDQPWKLRLPVVDCCPIDDPDCNPKIGPCTRVVGAVEVNVLWITDGNREGDSTRAMAKENSMWTCNSTWTDQQCWDGDGDPSKFEDSFVKQFNVYNYDGSKPFFGRNPSIFCRIVRPKSLMARQVEKTTASWHGFRYL